MRPMTPKNAGPLSRDAILQLTLFVNVRSDNTSFGMSLSISRGQCRGGRLRLRLRDADRHDLAVEPLPHRADGAPGQTHPLVSWPCG